MKIPFDVEQAGEEAIGIYVSAIENGTSESLAELLALRQSPSLNTDTTFMANRGTLLQQLDGDHEALTEVMRGASKSGFRPTDNHVYIEGLARYPGDPEAFITGKGDVRNVCEKRGQACHGSVEVKHREPEHDPHESKPLAGDIVQGEMQSRIAADPSLKRKRDLKDQVIDDHSMK